MPSARFRKGLLVAAGVSVVVALGAVGGRAWLQSDGMRARVLDRVKPALESRLGEVRIGDPFEVGWDAALTLGPVELPGSSPELPPIVRVDRLTVRPKLVALLSGRAELDQVELDGVRIEAGPRGSELLARVERIRELRSAEARATGSSLPTHDAARLPPVRISRLYLGVEWGRRIEVGPIGAEVQVEPLGGASTRIELNASLPEGGTALLSWERGPEVKTPVRLEVRGLSADALLALAEPPFLSQGGRIDADVRADATSARFTGRLHGLTLASSRLASEPVGPLTLAAEGDVRWSLEEKRIDLESLRISAGEKGEARLSLTGAVSLRAEPRFQIEAELAPLSFEDALAALPKALVPEPELLKLQGKFSARFTVSGPVLRHPEWEVRAKLNLAGLEREARSSPLYSFNAPFNYRPLTAEGRGREIHVGPGNPNFIPYAELPNALVRAVLLSEDSMFFTHAGFDFHALKNNLLAARKEGEVVRGGSTLTQQLAKNLFLSREKTYARKVKEAFLTLGLEASVPKERLLEIYFNVVEWGPGLYGIGEAARHYFDKDARALTVREAAFLAAIIPNPVKYHVYCSRGALTETWQKRMTDLLLKMYGAGDLTVEQLVEAEHASLVFAHR